MMGRLHRARVWGRAASWLVVGVLVIGGLLSALELSIPPARALSPHGPIAIVGNAEFTPANGVTSGTGAPGDPYVIEGWDIDASSARAIYLADTTAAFVIRNVSVRSEYGYAGILIHNVSDGRVDDARSFTDVGVEASVRVAMSRINMSGAHLFASASSDVLFANMTMSGVSIVGSSGVVFQDNDVQAFNTGAYFMFDPNNPNRRGSNYTILRNRFTPIAPWVVYVQGVDGITMADNEFSRVELDVSDIRFGTIRNNTLNDVPWGNGVPGVLGLRASKNVEISDNLVSGDFGTSLVIGSSENLTVSGNNITSPWGRLAIQGSTNATVRTNRVTGVGIYVAGSEFSQYATHTFGTDNTVNGLPFVAYKNCTDLSIDSVSIAELLIVGCKRVRVSGLTIANAAMGIALVDVDDALVDGNRLSGIGMEAIKVFGGTNVIIRANYLTGMWTAMGISSAVAVTISENTMEGNNVGAEVVDTTNGRAFHNNFIHSGWYDHDQARGVSTTNFAWDDGYPSGGNYWSDYTWTDTGGDGIGDVAYGFAVPGGVDRYPLILPWGRPPIPPVARISTDNATPVAGQGVAIGGTSSTDEDGSILIYHYDFGDGSTSGGFGANAGIVFHAFENPGNYTATLTVTDNSGLTNRTSMVFTVRVPTDPPRAYFIFGPPEPRYPGTPVFFTAEDSSTRYGTITSYVWDFGDGGVAGGDRAFHAFQTSGSFHVQLTVTNSWGYSDTTGREITIAAIPDIPLVMYSHPSGFRLPIPEAWARSENERIGDTTLALVLRGPQHDNFQTNILVDAISDSSVREDRASMENLVGSLIDDLRKNDAGLVVSEAPEYRTVSNHSAAVFAIQHSTSPVEQKIAIVVSEAHEKTWLILLSVRTSQYILYSATFERMVDGFVITAPPKAPSPFIAIGSEVVAVASISVVLWFYFWRKRRVGRPTGSVPPLPVAYGAAMPAAMATPGMCLRCGSSLGQGYFFCANCGSPTGLFNWRIEPPRSP